MTPVEISEIVRKYALVAAAFGAGAIAVWRAIAADRPRVPSAIRCGKRAGGRRPTVDLLSAYLAQVNYNDEEPTADVSASMQIILPRAETRPDEKR